MGGHTAMAIIRPRRQYETIESGTTGTNVAYRRSYTHVCVPLLKISIVLTNEQLWPTYSHKSLAIYRYIYRSCYDLWL